MLNLLNLTCTWCEKNNLELYECGNGFYVGCSNPESTDCPNTTGVWPTAREAIDCAEKYVTWLKTLTLLGIKENIENSKVKSDKKINFSDLIQPEVDRSRQYFPSAFHSTHEALGVIAEEYHELCLEVYKKRPNTEDLLHELVQLAAMCQRAAEDLKLLGDDN